MGRQDEAFSGSPTATDRSAPVAPSEIEAALVSLEDVAELDPS